MSLLSYHFGLGDSCLPLGGSALVETVTIQSLPVHRSWFQLDFTLHDVALTSCHIISPAHLSLNVKSIHLLLYILLSVQTFLRFILVNFHSLRLQLRRLDDSLLLLIVVMYFGLVARVLLLTELGALGL